MEVQGTGSSMAFAIRVIGNDTPASRFKAYVLLLRFLENKGHGKFKLFVTLLGSTNLKETAKIFVVIDERGAQVVRGDSVSWRDELIALSGYRRILNPLLRELVERLSL